ncbi:MAG: universal stress protein [Desulfobacterales bacterium]|nr:universal stress protein [Desulfobacterales bacterium]
MKEFNKILFPVDLSESSPKLVPYVTLMARKFGSEIHILFVARVFEYFSGIYVPHPSISKFEDEVVQGAKKRIEEFTEEYFSDFPATNAKVVAGDISEEILKYTVSNGIDLLIMGTHGRKGLEKVVFGSVAERVAKTSPVPVLLINPYKVS